MMLFRPMIGACDLALLGVVSIQATILARVADPRWKAFILSLPLPFTVAVLAVGRPVDQTNVLGLILLLGFMHGVRWMHYGLRAPVVLAIALATLGYGVLARLAAGLLYPGALGFWLSSLGALLIAVILIRAVVHREEPSHHSPLPFWIKLPITMGVVLVLILLKTQLRGFMTVFPMVGVTAAYETRKSLWTTCRQIPVLMLAMTPMMMVCFISQSTLGLGPSLVIGWAVFLTLLGGLSRSLWSRTRLPDR